VLAYALRRAAWAVMLCLILSLFTFVIFYVVPRGQDTQRTRGRLADIQRTQGQVLRNALIRNDLPVIVGVVVVTALVIAIVNFVGDVIQALIDPRVKLQPEPA
jgi:ABC-type dipeptide/oligopeptide/nickel transport system permease component